jgi:fatty-acyl-CoA synthase
VLLVDEFPMTVTGKIRKVQMREETTEKLGLSGVEERAPADDVGEARG